LTLSFFPLLRILENIDCDRGMDLGNISYLFWQMRLLFTIVNNAGDFPFRIERIDFRFWDFPNTGKR
jgi:hypothetical protein